MARLTDTQGRNGVKNLNSFSRFVAIGGLLALALAGCGTETPEALIDSAKSLLAKGDYKGSAIQLRNVLQKRPQDAEARYLFGQALIEDMDYVSAEKELRKALEYGYVRDGVYATLAHAMVAQGQGKEVVAEFKGRTLADPDAAASLKTDLGFAYFGLGQSDDARGAFEAALKAKPGYARARVGQAVLLASNQNVADAMQIVDEVLATAPTSPDALNFKADLLLLQNDTKGAIKVAEQAVKTQPNKFQPRYGLVLLRIRENDLVEAAAEIDAMRKAFPTDPRLSYLDALLAFRQGNATKTRDAVQQMLKAVPDHAPSLYLAGAAQYQLRSFDSAAEYLRRAISQSPQSTEAQLLLISNYLEAGHPERAQVVVDAAMRRVPNDPKVLALAGATALATKDLTKAFQYYERAAALDKEDALTRTRLGQARSAIGDVDGAVKDFELASKLDATGYQADLALIAAHLRQKEYDKALEAASVLERKLPNSALPYHIKGSLLAEMRDYRNARANFAKALELQFDYLPAAGGLARLDIIEKNPAAARNRFEAIIAKQPGNAEAIVELASVQAATGVSTKDVKATLERAVAASPESATATLALANYHLREGDAKSALAILQGAAAANPGDIRILELLAVAQQAGGEGNQAIATYTRLVAMQPTALEPLMRLAAAHYVAKNYDASIQTLRRALVLKPGSLDVRTEIINVNVAAGRTDDALAEARAIEKELPKEAAGFVLEGGVYAAQKKWDQAANAYREALKRQPAAWTVIRLHAVLQVQGKLAAAQALVTNWVRDNPKDATVRVYLAERAMQDKNFKEAAKLYKEILPLRPNDLVVLNNLAWAAMETNDPGAVDYAEKAYALAPEDAAVIDTYGWLLLRNGDVKRAVELLTAAVNLSPKNPDIRLHLARALIEVNDKAAARKEVEILLKLDAAAPQRAEAEALLKGL